VGGGEGAVVKKLGVFSQKKKKKLGVAPRVNRAQSETAPAGEAVRRDRLLISAGALPFEHDSDPP
jgi:hypothetical protein